MLAADRLTEIEGARDDAVAALLKIVNMDNANYASMAACMFSYLVTDKTQAVLVLQRVVDREEWEGYNQERLAELAKNAAASAAR